MSSLPSELLHHIIDCLIPLNPPVAFLPSHHVTCSLRSFSLVSKIAYPIAARLLYAHCLHIDSLGRLELLLCAISDSDSFARRFIFNRLNDARPELAEYSKTNATSLFLAPFPNDSIDSIDDHHIAESIFRLFTILAPSLTRLVIDIPLRSLWPENDTYNVRPILRAAFQMLSTLEEFVSTRDELFLATYQRPPPDETSIIEPEVWPSWHRLKRLALYNVDVASGNLLQDISKCKSLTHLVLTRADGLSSRVQSRISPSPSSSQLQTSTHLQRVLIVNTTNGHIPNPAFSRRRWDDCFLGKIWDSRLLPKISGEKEETQIVRIDVPLASGQGDEDMEACQEWVRDAAIQGTLWDWKGTLLIVGETVSDIFESADYIDWERPDASVETSGEE